ncbi:MAG: hypothetical protein DRP74_08845 [Candidatus Omnitrophota bacterium]|nr:MAG: hypothetical protein DRP74_08845 [Candidatus Omnitrophota bacterium]
MAEYVKSLWSETERELIENGRIDKPEYIRQYRYKVRRKIKYYIAQLMEALMSPHIRTKRLIPLVLNMAEETLRAYGYKEEYMTIRKIRIKILEDVFKESNEG